MAAHDRADTLRTWRSEIIDFARAHLKLGLRDPGAEPEAAEGGIDFVGWKAFWNYRLPHRQILSWAFQ